MKKLNVFLSFSNDDELFVGEIAEKNNRLYFQYDGGFIEKALWLSPYKLPLGHELYEYKDLSFGPIWGLFDDSLPDGWGLLLMDRFLRKQGISTRNMSILDRLSFFGSTAMGALTYKPEILSDYKKNNDFNLYDLYIQSQEILNGTSQEVLSQLMRAGGSPGGARPKVLVGVNGDQCISGEGILPEGYEHWIVKFRGENDFNDSANIEYAYSLMARSAGLQVTETRLFNTEQGDKFFGIERFDRNHNSRVHTHTFGNLIHSDFRIPSCDYDTFLRVTRDLTKNYSELLKGFRQMVFNICSNNRDDHVKNFSYQMDREGQWSLSPSYDLIYSDGPGGEHSMTVNGEGMSPTLKDIKELGKNADIRNSDMNKILDQVITAVRNWTNFAETANVSSESIDVISDSLYVKRLIEF